MSTLTESELSQLNKYFNAANYLAVGQLYLLDNPLLKEELKLEHIKPRLVGHWGTIPGQNFIFMHLNRVITKYNLNMIYLVGPGHGGQTAVTNAYLDGTYTEVYPEITKDEAGLKKLFKQFSFPGGISSHVAPETPGSIHEGGELGYTLAHGFGAVLDNPSLIATCIVGDGEAETGPLATSWHINKFINPLTDGVVLPILHLNGFKISNATVLSRMPNKEVESLFKGYGWNPYFVEGSDIDEMQEKMASTMDKVISEILSLKEKAKSTEMLEAYKWPMIVFRTPKGWTGPTNVEGSFKAHQVPLEIDENHLENIPVLEEWLRKYKIEEIFDDNGKVKDELCTFLPKGNQRMSANKIVNGGLILEELKLPEIKDYMLDCHHGDIINKDMFDFGKYVRDIVKLNEVNHNFRIFGPDEAMSNRLNHVFEETSRQWLLPITDKDEFTAPYGRVIDSYLSEHLAEGALEGYLLTGRHGFIHSYEAFIRVIDSMIGLHAKWLKITKEIPWRAPISSLNIIETSHIWQQDHNGYTHQEPGFINHILNKKRDITEIYLPYDTNSLLYYANKAFKSKNKINTIVASKHERPQWLNYEETIKHCDKGIGIWDFASDENPDVIFACAGDTPTLEVMAATSIIKERSDIKVRVVNVVDLLTLERISDEEFDLLFPENIPVIFAFHGYKSAVEGLIYNRKRKFIVHGYQEEGSITTPFDMRVINKIDRYNLTISALNALNRADDLKAYCEDKLNEHHQLIRDTGRDLKEVTEWQWKDA
ncbi:MAG: phosphoketolase family protein [Erysipelotrichales bacterium]|nr:phosphoketolase family protein [Erysipelotrichales bacterium]